MSAPRTFFKIVARSEWDEAVQRGLYEGSAHDVRDGFIHFSLADQLRGTAEKHFAGQLNLVLVTLDESRVGPSLKYEPARDGSLFPHLYGPLDVRAAIAVVDLPWDGQAHAFPEGTAT